MKINHKTLGECNVLVHWNGSKNQIALVTCDKTYGVSNKWGRDFVVKEVKRKNRWTPSKPQYWIIWTSLDLDIETGGITRMETPSGRAQTPTSAIRSFMKLTQFADTMTFKKIIRCNE